MRLMTAITPHKTCTAVGFFINYLYKSRLEYKSEPSSNNFVFETFKPPTEPLSFHSTLHLLLEWAMLNAVATTLVSESYEM